MMKTSRLKSQGKLANLWILKYELNLSANYLTAITQFHLFPPQQIIEKFLYALQDRRPGMSVIDSAPQGASVRDAMREPGHELLHLARRALLRLIDQHLEISPDHLVAIGFRRLVIAAGFGMLANLAE